MLNNKYHTTLGFPAGLAMPQPGMRLAYSGHAIDKAMTRTDAALLPLRLPASFDIIEVSTFAGVAVHWLVRFPLKSMVETMPGNWAFVDSTHDVVMALGTTLAEPLTVRTVYLNHKDDAHKTLRTENYNKPEGR